MEENTKGIDLENLTIYRPTFVHYLIFHKEKRPKKVKGDGPIKVGFEEAYAKNSQVREDADYLVVELHKELDASENQVGDKEKDHSMGQVGIVGGPTGPTETEGWVDIEATVLLKYITKIKESGETTAQRTLKDNAFLRFIGSYTVLCCGSKKNYWLETQIDVKGFMKGGKDRRLKEVSSTSRIKSLNWIISGTNLFRGNILGVTGTPSKLFGFGSISYRQMENFKGIFLADIPLESEGDTEGSVELVERYKNRMETTTSNLGKLLAYHSMLLNHNKMEYTRVDKQANILRNEVLNIQERIFNLQKSAGETTKKTDELKDLSRMRAEEEDLLTSASITFSAVTRLEQTIGTNMYTSFGLNKSLEEILDAMDAKRIETLEGEFEPVPSLFDEFNRFTDSVNVAYEMLRDNVNITQTTLRNSLEVLRTFIEHQRGKVADLQSRTFSIILVIFACFGIADALSNVLAYYIGDRTMEALFWTIGAFVFSMAFSLMIFVILYIWIIKKVLA